MHRLRGIKNQPTAQLWQGVGSTTTVTEDSTARDSNNDGELFLFKGSCVYVHGSLGGIPTKTTARRSRIPVVDKDDEDDVAGPLGV